MGKDNEIVCRQTENISPLKVLLDVPETIFFSQISEFKFWHLSIKSLAMNRLKGFLLLV